MKKQTTYMQTSAQVTRTWHVVDISGQVLGRAATEIAKKLIGKHKPTYTPHIDAGDYVIVLNAGAVVVTRGKADTKVYSHHSGHPGGLKQQTFAQVQAKHPERLIEEAVSCMLPKNKLRRDRMARLKIFTGSDHPHQGQVATAAQAA